MLCLTSYEWHIPQPLFQTITPRSRSCGRFMWKERGAGGGRGVGEGKERQCGGGPTLTIDHFRYHKSDVIPQPLFTDNSNQDQVLREVQGELVNSEDCSDMWGHSAGPWHDLLRRRHAWTLCRKSTSHSLSRRRLSACPVSHLCHNDFQTESSLFGRSDWL